jgi:hypothetical protein
MATLTAGVPKLSAPAAPGVKQHATWSPYDDNGGTTLAVAGADYCIVAASTRMSTGYSILTRRASKVLALTDKCVIATAGFQADTKALHKMLRARNVTYQHAHGKPMACGAVAQLLSNTLYHRRFFPLYTFNICAGLDEEGAFCVWFCLAVRSFFCVAQESALAHPAGFGCCCCVKNDKTKHRSLDQKQITQPHQPSQPSQPSTTNQARAPCTRTTRSAATSARATRARAAART